MESPYWQLDEVLAETMRSVRSSSPLGGTISQGDAWDLLSAAGAAAKLRLLAARLERGKNPIDDRIEDAAPIPSQVIPSLKPISAPDGTELWLTNRATASAMALLGLLPHDRHPGVFWTSVVVSRRDWQREVLDARRHSVAAGRGSLGSAIISADRAEFPDGPPEGMLVATRRSRVLDRLKKDYGITAVSDRTFQRYGIGKN